MYAIINICNTIQLVLCCSNCVCFTVAGRWTEATVGYYRVRAVDYWNRSSAFSAVVYYPAT